MPDGVSAVGEIPCPEGYTRVAAEKSDFAAYLRLLPFKEENVVLLYNGEKKGNQNANYAVIKMDVGKKDLQQCADAVMRLRAEYLYEQKRYSEIAFCFTSGDTARFSKYIEGYRSKVSGNNVSWVKTGTEGNTYEQFRNYLDMVFMYAGTASLEKELKVVESLGEILPGDVFIKGGSPGHAVIVADVAVNAEGKKVFMLAQSYMPAQEIHVLVNPTDETLSPWYVAENNGRLITPEWDFSYKALKRF
ncbi:MAG: DUF4846 domain-containing protein [Bacteroidetes bacterium]|nr:DUF4846 domain-containing protein [Bacteroidota bacterium]MBU1718719.1 DUF4846 domain-containing protein [Bacteroidota bacterium]